MGDAFARAGVSDADAAGLTGAVTGYVADAPASARVLLEPLMAAYDFTAGEREGRIVFTHRQTKALATLAVGSFTEASASGAFSERGDSADWPIEARVRFLDATRDYAVAGVSARRLDRAEGGVEFLRRALW